VHRIVSAEAVEFIRREGGRLYVWGGDVCCGGTRFVKTSTEEPADAPVFHRFDEDGYQLYVKPVHGQLPDELHVDLRGRRRARAQAYWNGCAYVL
jgi:hypothetical protein